MKSSLIIFLFVCFTASLQATTQVPEKLDYEGVAYDMYSTPMKSQFSDRTKRPVIIQPTSSACYRGYVGQWKISKGKLYLVSLQKGYPLKGIIKLEEVNKNWKSPILADWYTGKIRLGKGKYVTRRMGFGSTRESEIHLELVKGKVTSIKRVTHGNSDKDDTTK